VIAGAGIGGLTAALALDAQGIEVQVYEATRDIRPLGVGINLLPHAMGALDRLGLLDAIAALGIPTAELCFFNRHGQLIWREPRGLAAGYSVPQISLHRGELQMALLAALRERAGDDVVVTGHALHGFDADAALDAATTGTAGIGIELHDREHDRTVTDHADLLVGADGIHSATRARFYPDEGPPNWQGDVLWRGTTWAEPFLTGRSMFMAGHLPHKFVAYPITDPGPDGRCLVNWIAELDRTDEGLTGREDWNRRGSFDDFLPRFVDWRFDWLDVGALIQGADEVFEYPMVDRDPLPRWTFGRVTLLGDAAHPMFPIGSNGASQAILDALALADALAPIATGGDRTGGGSRGGSGAALAEALATYESARRPATAAIVLANRQHGPERVLDLAEARAPDGFGDIADVFAAGELESIAASYKQTAGFVAPTTASDPAS
jgi:2-polyprenyl-6-methoxyphenol hydroxylase-like FAD-dependent oxidoreductase